MTAKNSTVDKAGGLRRVSVLQGETRVSDDEQVVLTTVLGSCIAACLYDPEVGVGGLNHFLLSEPGGDADPNSIRRYGVYAMEVLINAMLAVGASRIGLRARIYGGASMHGGFRDIGATNTSFARRFLQDERIALVGEDVGGTAARRLDFRAAFGLARCRTITDASVRKAALPIVQPPIPTALGDVEFF